MTKLEEKLLAQIRARLAELDVRASDKLAALLPALRKLTEGYAALGAAVYFAVRYLLCWTLPRWSVCAAGWGRS